MKKYSREEICDGCFHARWHSCCDSFCSCEEGIKSENIDRICGAKKNGERVKKYKQHRKGIVTKKVEMTPDMEITKSMGWEKAESCMDDEGDAWIVYFNKDPHYLDLKELIKWVKKHHPELLE